MVFVFKVFVVTFFVIIVIVEVFVVVVVIVAAWHAFRLSDRRGAREAKYTPPKSTNNCVETSFTFT